MLSFHGEWWRNTPLIGLKQDNDKKYSDKMINVMELGPEAVAVYEEEDRKD